MYLGYDESGNIITRDPSGERGECERRLLGSGEMTREEMMGAWKRKAIRAAKAAQSRRQAHKEAKAKAFQKALQARKSASAAKRNAAFLRKMRFAKKGGMYAGLSGVMGDGLAPHHVSGEVIAETFKSNYGLNGADFGRGEMGGYTPDFVKKAVNGVYLKALKIETTLAKKQNALSRLKAQNKTSTAAYKALKASYDKLYKAYQNTPVKVGPFKWKSRRQMFVDFGMKLKALIAKIDPKAATNMALMFAAPVVYDTQVKKGAIKASFSGYGFGSEFDYDEGMGVVPLLAIAGWKAIAAAFVGGGALYTVYQYATNPIPAIDGQIASSDKLISDALKAGQYEVAKTLTEQRSKQIEQKTEAVESSGITGQIKSATKNIAKTASMVAIGFLIIKFGLPMLQSKMSQPTTQGS